MGTAESAPVLYVRTVADALERHLEKANTHVHWARPDGRETSWGPPQLVWPKDPSLGYMLQHGHSEGTLLRVMHQQDRYDAATQQPLIVVKFLCGFGTASVDMKTVYDFLESLDVAQLLIQQEAIRTSRVARMKESESARTVCA